MAFRMAEDGPLERGSSVVNGCHERWTFSGGQTDRRNGRKRSLAEHQRRRERGREDGTRPTEGYSA